MDTPEKYTVLTNGNVLEGYDLESVKAAFSKKFNIKLELAHDYFAGKSKMIKKDVDDTTAQKYKAALVNLGIDARVEKMQKPNTSSALDSLSLIPIGNETPASTARMNCPKCGVEQVKAIGCESCGIIIEKYESAQQLLNNTSHSIK